MLTCSVCHIPSQIANQHRWHIEKNEASNKKTLGARVKVNVVKGCRDKNIATLSVLISVGCISLQQIVNSECHLVFVNLVESSDEYRLC